MSKTFGILVAIESEEQIPAKHINDLLEVLVESGEAHSVESTSMGQIDLYPEAQPDGDA